MYLSFRHLYGEITFSVYTSCKKTKEFANYFKNFKRIPFRLKRQELFVFRDNFSDVFL